MQIEFLRVRRSHSTHLTASVASRGSLSPPTDLLTEDLYLFALCAFAHNAKSGAPHSVFLELQHKKILLHLILS